MKTKIAVVIPKYGLVGGGERYVQEQTERLALNPDFDIHVFANKWLKHSENVTFHKVPLISFPRFLTTISFAFFANYLISKIPFDLIHSHERIFKADIFTMHGIPHNIWVKEVRRKRRSLFDIATAWVEKNLIKKGSCKHFISVSSLAQHKFQQEYTVPTQQMHIIHPGVNIKQFSSESNKHLFREKIRNKFQIEPDETVILFVSMNFELKGLDSIFSALALLIKEDFSKDIKLLIVGKGDQRKYVQLAKNLGILKHVIFTGTWHEKIEQVYFASDIFIMLSKFDTFGMSVLEAMTASLPVIISENVGAKDIVQEGRSGFILKQKNTNELVGKIKVLLNKKTRDTMAQQAFEQAQSQTWDKGVQSLSSIYFKILECT